MDNTNSNSNLIQIPDQTIKITESKEEEFVELNEKKGLDDFIPIVLSQKKEITAFKLFCKKDSFVIKERKIAEYYIGTKKCSLFAPVSGRIVSIDEDEYKIIVQRCQHDQTYYNLCVYCGYDVRKEKVPSSSTYLSMSSSVGFSEQRAKKEEEKIVQKYLNDKKLILLLDLDNTILHAANLSFSEDEYQSLRNKYGREIAKLTIANQTFLVKFRPFLKEFFEEIGNYDIYVYTYGTLDYAKTIIKYLAAEYDVKSLNFDKLVARENNTFESKNIKKIFPSTENMVVILDDRTDVWTNTNNLINISPYFFFSEEKNFKLDGKKHLEEDKDCVLYSVWHLMRFVHASFYRFYELNNDLEYGSEAKTLCVKTILSNNFKRIFDKKKFCLSGVYPLGQDIFETKHNFFIEMFGGSLYEDYTDEVDIVLVRKLVDSKKVNKALEDKKLILCDIWLDYCYYFFTYLNVEDFVLNKERDRLAKEIYCLNFNYVLEKNKELISKYYSIEDENVDLFLKGFKKE